MGLVLGLMILLAIVAAPISAQSAAPIPARAASPEAVAQLRIYNRILLRRFSMWIFGVISALIVLMTLIAGSDPQTSAEFWSGGILRGLILLSPFVGLAFLQLHRTRKLERQLAESVAREGNFYRCVCGREKKQYFWPHFTLTWLVPWGLIVWFFKVKRCRDCGRDFLNSGEAPPAAAEPPRVRGIATETPKTPPTVTYGRYDPGRFDKLASAAFSAAIPDKLEPGQFQVHVVDNYRDAQMSLNLIKMKGAGETLALAVMAFGQPGSALRFEGEDRNGKSVSLDGLTEPAVLLVPRDTLKHLKQNAAIWRRVTGVRGD